MSIRIMAAAAAVAAGLAIATCGPAADAAVADTAVAGSSVADAAAAGAAAIPAARAVQLTGLQLLAALLPASDFPAGYKLDKSGIYDSGARLLTAPAKYHLATQSCTSFANHFGQRGYGETAVASDDFANSGPTIRDFGQEVYQFKSSRAATAIFNGLRAIVRRCPKFAFTGAGPDVKVTTKIFNAPAIGGHRTFQMNQTGTIQGFKFGLNLVFTVAGQDLFFTGNVGAMTTPPASPSPRTTMFRLINRVRAFR
jgi:hypothetical protein